MLQIENYFNYNHKTDKIKGEYHQGTMAKMR